MILKKTAIILIIAGILLTALGIYAVIHELFVQGLIALIFICGVALINGGISFFFITQEKALRKKSIVVLSVIAAAIFLIGLFSRFFHLLGASIEIIEGAFLFGFGAGPLAIRSRYEKWREFSVSAAQTFLLSMTDWLSGIMLTLGITFKLMHWPIGTFLIILGGLLLVIAILLWNNVFKRQIVLRKMAEEKLSEAFDQLSEKHTIIENKNKEIIDSINYAKRIQRSLLPTERYIRRSLDRLQKK